MLSRIADSLFWLNRYQERSEGMLRLIRTNYVLSLDKSPTETNSWLPLLEIFSNKSYVDQIKLSENHQEVINHLLLDASNNNSLQANLTKARENARGMQDHITKEVWEQVNYLYHIVHSQTLIDNLQENKQLQAIEHIQKNCLLYTGIVDSTMPRGMSWSFMNLGKYIERSILTIDILEKHFAGIDFDFNKEKGILYWRNLLFSVSGYEFHLKNYRNNDTNLNVAHQIIYNEQFPHSLSYSLNRVQKYLENVIEENKVKNKNSLVKEFGRIYSNIEFTDLDWINKMGMSVYLQTSKYNLIQFTNSLSQTFFSYT